MFKGASGFHAGEVGGAPPVGTGGIYGGDGTVSPSCEATLADAGILFTGGLLAVKGGGTDDTTKALQISTGGDDWGLTVFDSQQVLVMGSEEDGISASAMLQCGEEGETFGFLPPRMEDADFDLIVDPTHGLMAFSMTTNALRIWNEMDWGTNLHPTVFTDLSVAVDGTATWEYKLSSCANLLLEEDVTLEMGSTELYSGSFGTLKVTQDATGGRTLTLPLDWHIVNDGGGTVTLSTAAGAVDIICWVYDDEKFWVTIGLNFTGA